MWLGVEKGQYPGGPWRWEPTGLRVPSMVLLLQGKFIRIHFGPTGKLASADIDSCESGKGQGRCWRRDGG